MSVVVIGMDMPNTCEECKTSCEVGSDMHCLVTDAGNKWGWKLSESGFYSRPDWCPLRPLPEKHGRLIDAEAFKAMCRETVADLRETVFLPHEKKMVERLADATEALCLDLDEAPTIVEAEGGRDA